MAIIVHTWSEFIAAVGTSGAEVEFPKNLVKTQDTDVDPNKLYTDANGVVQTNVQPSDLANLYENTFVLDANSSDGFPEGLTAKIEFNCASINGYGGYIKNLAARNIDYMFHTDTVSRGTISGIAFLNIYCENTHFFYTSNPSGFVSVYFTKCIFTGRFVNTNTNSYYTKIIFGWDRGTPFTMCSFNFEISGYWLFVRSYDSSPFNYCRIYIDSDEFSLLNFKVINSYVLGESDLGISLASGSQYTVVNVATSRIDSSVSDICLINTDSYSGTIPSHCVGVTTEQLKDAEYLASLGFPIQT
jgi:hypothetical protein